MHKGWQVAPTDLTGSLAVDRPQMLRYAKPSLNGENASMAALGSGGRPIRGLSAIVAIALAAIAL